MISKHINSNLQQTSTDGNVDVLVRFWCSCELKTWCNAKATVFKVIFYLTYLFILIRNAFCCSHSWQLKQQNTKPVRDDLICICQHKAPSSHNQPLCAASVNFSVMFNEKMGGKNIKSGFITVQFSNPLTGISRFPGNRQPPGAGENSFNNNRFSYQA